MSEMSENTATDAATDEEVAALRRAPLAPLAPLVTLAGSWPGLDDAARLAALDRAIEELYAARRVLVAEVVADERGRYPHGVVVRAAARLGISRQSVGRIAGHEHRHRGPMNPDGRRRV